MAADNIHSGWKGVDSSLAHPLNKEQKLRPMLEVLTSYERSTARTPTPCALS